MWFELSQASGRARDLPHFFLQLVGFGGTLRHEVVALAAVLGDLIQLRARRDDQFPLVGSHAAQLRPAHGTLGIERLHVAVVAPHTLAINDRGHEAYPLNLLFRQTQKIQHGRHDVDGTDLLRDDSRAGHARALDDQRDVNRGVVQEHPVRVFTMVAEALAVIGHEKDKRFVPQAVLSEALEQATHLVVRVGYLSGIQVPFVARAEGLGRIVGEVGVVVVHPQEKVRGAIRARTSVDPVQRARRYDFAPELRHDPRQFLGGLFTLHVVAIDGETAIHAVLAVQHGGADKGGGVKSRPREDRGESRHLAVEDESAHVAHFMDLGVAARQDGCV